MRILLASPLRARVIGVMLVIITWYVDRMTGVQLSFVLFYMVAIAYGTWYDGKALGIALAVLSAILWLEADLFSVPNSHLAFQLWNTVSRLIQFLVMVWLVHAVHKTHSERLQHEVDKYTRFVESAIEGMIILGDDGKIRSVNNGAATLLSLPRKELEGKSIWDLLQDDKSRAAIETVVLERAKSEGTFEVCFTGSGGDPVWALVNAKASGETPGGDWETILLLMDISERKKAEEKLRHQYEQISATQRLSTELQRSLVLRERMEGSVDTVLQVTGFDGGSIHLGDATGTTLKLKASRGLSQQFIEYVAERPLHWGIPGRVIQTGVPSFVADVRQDPHFDPRFGEIENIQSYACIPLLSKQETIGVLNLLLRRRHEFPESERLMLQTFGRQIGVAIENAQLFESTRKREEQIRLLSVDLMKVQEDERKRFARELHDGLTQLLTTLMINAEMAFKTYRTDPDAAEKLLREVLAMSDEALSESKQIADDLRPAILDDFGLKAAIEWQTANFSRRSGIRVDLHLFIEDRRFESIVETTVYRIIQELLANVAKHSGATLVTIQLLARGTVIALTVSDNGKGVDKTQSLRIVLGRTHHGLRNLRERTESLGGTFRYESVTPHGSEFTFELPLSQAQLAGVKGGAA